MSAHRSGFLYAASAYFLWGLFPLYWPLLEPAGPAEILADRVLWTLVVIAVALAIRHRWAWLAALRRDRRRLLMLSAAAVLIALNWGTFIYGVNSGRVVETSLGYFINPLVTVGLGVLVLGERLRRLQWCAVSLGVVAVVVLTIGYGRPPWIALVLAFSFGTYGLLKKTVGMPPLESLGVEAAVLVVPAVVFLAWAHGSGRDTALSHGPDHFALLASTGLVTAAPLLLFGAAANRLPLTWLGLLQYIAPVMQFGLGVWYFAEQMPLTRWIGFGLVWCALVAISLESIRGGQSAPSDVGVELCSDAAEAH